MSLIAIILHYWEPELEIGPTYGAYIGSLIYHKFIVGEFYLEILASYIEVEE